MLKYMRKNTNIVDYESGAYKTILEMPSMMKKNGRERFI